MTYWLNYESRQRKLLNFIDSAISCIQLIFFIKSFPINFSVKTTSANYKIDFNEVQKRLSQGLSLNI